MPHDVPSVLQEIVAYKHEEVAARKAAQSHVALDGLPPPRGFAAAIARENSPNQLRDYLQTSHALGMDTLVEVHTEAELEIALAADAPIIGVNNRDLNTFATDLATTARFAARIKTPGSSANRILVSESGIGT